MNRIKKTMAIASVLIFSLLGATAYANSMNRSYGSTNGSYELRDLLWTSVQNLDGKYVGTVSNFVIDSQGHVSLAIIDRSSGEANKPGELVAVPFELLKWNAGGDYFVLNVSKEVFAEVPSFHKSKDLSNPAFAAEMYRFFGLRPSWTGNAPNPYQWGGEAQDF